jgi:hypothetical protein
MMIACSRSVTSSAEKNQCGTSSNAYICCHQLFSTLISRLLNHILLEPADLQVYTPATVYDTHCQA